MFAGLRVRSRGTIRFVTISASVVLASTLAVPAMAQEQETDTSPSGTDTALSVPADDAEALTFELDQLGLGDSVEIGSDGAGTQLTVPVPPGTTPAALTGVLTVPAWLDRGWIDVLSADRPLTRIQLDSAAPTMPVSIPLDDAPVVDGSVTISMSSTLISDENYCPDTGGDPIRLIDADVAFAGAPSIPRNISEFLPPLLRQLTVFVPAEPDLDTVTAAMSLSTSVVAYYGAQPVRVVARPDSELQGADADGPFDRSVVITPNTDAGSQMIYPVDGSPPRLFVTGSGTQLTDQTRLITSSISQLAVSTAALARALRACRCARAGLDHARRSLDGNRYPRREQLGHRVDHRRPDPTRPFGVRHVRPSRR